MWGAITGTVALVWQILAERPNIVVRAGIYDEVFNGQVARKNVLYIRAYNAGKHPVRLTNGGLKGNRKTRSVIVIPEPGKLPITLQPGDETEVSTGDLGSLKEAGYTEPYDTACFIDCAGRYYLARVTLWRRIRRWIWLTFNK